MKHLVLYTIKKSVYISLPGVGENRKTVAWAGRTGNEMEKTPIKNDSNDFLQTRSTNIFKKSYLECISRLL